MFPKVPITIIKPNKISSESKQQQSKNSNNENNPLSINHLPPISTKNKKGLLVRKSGPEESNLQQLKLRKLNEGDSFPITMNNNHGGMKNRDKAEEIEGCNNEKNVGNEEDTEESSAMEYFQSCLQFEMLEEERSNDINIYGYENEVGKQTKEAIQTQLKYIDQHTDKTNIEKISKREFLKRWNYFENNGLLIYSNQDEDAQVIQVDPKHGAAVGSKGAGPCIIAFVKATTNDGKTFLGSIHVSTGDTKDEDSAAFTPQEAFSEVFDRLNKAVHKKSNGKETTNEYSLIGGNIDDSRESCVALIHAAKILGLTLKGCLLTANVGDQMIDAMMTDKGDIYYYQDSNI